MSAGGDREIEVTFRSEADLFFGNLPDRLSRLPSLLSNAHRGIVPRNQSGQGVYLVTHFNLVLKLRMYGTVPPLPHIREISKSVIVCYNEIAWVDQST